MSLTLVTADSVNTSTEFTFTGNVVISGAAGIVVTANTPLYLANGQSISFDNIANTTSNFANVANAAYTALNITDGANINANNLSVNGYFSANGSTGTAGQVLASDGANGVYWTSPTGYFGSTGYVGSKGDLGFTGSQGASGLPGTTGYDGSAGEAGYTGSAGDLGYTGSAGDNGYTGSQGQIGLSSTSFEYFYSNNISNTAVANSEVKLNNDITLANTLFINKVAGVYPFDYSANSFYYYISNIYSGTKSVVSLYVKDSPYIFSSYTVTGQLTDYGDYISFPINLIAGSANNFQDGTNLVLSFSISGDNGYSGSIGFTGSQGNTGYSGSKGDLGYSGSFGFTGSIGYTGSQGNIGYSGSKGDIGFVGSQGPQGTFGGAAFEYVFSTNTTHTSTPNGYINFSNTNLSLANTLYIDYIDVLGSNSYSFIQTIDDSTSSIKGHFSVRDLANSLNYAMFAIVGAHFEDVDHFDIPISYLSGVTSFANGTNTVITFARTGDIGDTGYTGSKGDTGFVGSFGYTGSIGYTGSQGDVGFTGSQGIQGTTGFVGSQGGIGYTGSQGDLGYTGSKGDIGFTGSSGYSGSQGNIGFTGSQGISGYTGSQGDQGNIGYTGSKGDQGISGYTGSQGNNGYTGSQGDLGYSGSIGYTGSNGFTGSAGAGFVGSQGGFGYTGSQGDVGYTGSKGDLGYTGSQGSQGTTGFVGSQGGTGYTGSKGDVGYTGSFGLTGYTGSQGDQGTTGYVGSKGDLGYTGSQGPQGTFGGAAFDYTFNANTDNSDPGNGGLKFSNTNVSQANTLYINENADNFVSIYNFLQTIDDSTSSIKGHFTVTEKANTNHFAMFAITGSHTHYTNYFGVPTSFLSGSNTFSNGLDIIITFARTGDIGDTGYTGSQGTTGYAGSLGYTGSIGYTGSFGATGYVGSQGDQGTTGFVGSQGGTGYVGSKGDSGYIGSAGAGYTGSIGYTGSSGSANTTISSNSELFTANGSTNTFTLSTSTYSNTTVMVTLNGLLLTPSDHYGITGSTLSFVVTPANNDYIEVRQLTGYGQVGYTGSAGTGGGTVNLADTYVSVFLLGL